MSTDYIIEAGASRNFMALKLAEEQAEREEAAEKEEEATNPMKLLEKRTEASKNEMASLEALEELRELNQRKVNLDYDTMLNKYDVIRDVESRKDEEEDDRLIEELFGKNGQVIRRIKDDSDDDDEKPPNKKFMSSAIVQKPTDFLTNADDKLQNQEIIAEQHISEKSVGMISVNKKKLVLVKPKTGSTLTTSSNQLGSSALNSSAIRPPDQLPAKNSGSLSLLGAYSSSENSDSD